MNDSGAGGTPFAPLFHRACDGGSGAIEVTPHRAGMCADKRQIFMSTTKTASVYRFRATSWFNSITFETGWTVCASPEKGRPYNIPVGSNGEMLKFDTENEAKQYANKLNSEL